MKKAGILVAVVILFLSMVPAFADYNRYGVPDSSEIRAGLADDWFNAPLGLLRQNHVLQCANSVGIMFQVRMEERGDEFVIIVAPQSFINIDYMGSAATRTVKTEVYPETAPGSWVLYRSTATEKPLRIRYYFNTDSDVYVQFSLPDETIHDSGKSAADLVIFNAYAAHSVPVGIPFEKLYSASFADVRSWTQKALPWQYVTVSPRLYHASLQMAAVIRDNLGRISFAQDSGYDEFAHPVYISSGLPRTLDGDGNMIPPLVEEEPDTPVRPYDPMNEAASIEEIAPPEEHKAPPLTLSNEGFIKWIADGIVEPLCGSGLRLEPLKRPTVQFLPTTHNGIIDNRERIMFSLDWTRNLAAGIISVQTKRTYMYEKSGVDVTLNAFSARIGTDGKIANDAGYIKDAGYEVKSLKPVLYALAVTQPDYCYFAAVRQLQNDFPEEWVFRRSAVIFPYFDDNGLFCCTVFENGNEMTLAKFLDTCKNDYVHLVRVKTTDRFFPD